MQHRLLEVGVIRFLSRQAPKRLSDDFLDKLESDFVADRRGGRSGRLGRYLGTTCQRHVPTNQCVSCFVAMGGGGVLSRGLDRRGWVLYPTNRARRSSWGFLTMASPTATVLRGMAARGGARSIGKSLKCRDMPVACSRGMLKMRLNSKCNMPKACPTNRWVNV